MEYNGNTNSNSNDIAELIDIDQLYNKLNIRLLANDSIAHTKKRCVFEAKNEADESSKIKATWKKKIPVKQVDKKSSKVSVSFSSLVGKSFLNI